MSNSVGSVASRAPRRPGSLRSPCRLGAAHLDWCGLAPARPPQSVYSSGRKGSLRSPFRQGLFPTRPSVTFFSPRPRPLAMVWTLPALFCFLSCPVVIQNTSAYELRKYLNADQSMRHRMSLLQIFRAGAARTPCGWQEYHSAKIAASERQEGSKVPAQHGKLAGEIPGCRHGAG